MRFFLRGIAADEGFAVKLPPRDMLFLIPNYVQYADFIPTIF
jgi:hypothetical protein